MYIKVLVEVKAKSIANTYTYHVPTALEHEISLGKRVLVPFGNQEVEGFVLEYDNSVIDFKTKDIVKVLDENPVINEEMLKLGKWISKNNFSSLISTYQTMLPSALKASKKTNINKKYLTFLARINPDYEPRTPATKKVLELFRTNELVLKSDALKVSTSAVNTLIKNKVLEEVKQEEYRLKNKAIQTKCPIVLNDEQKKAYNLITENLDIPQTFLLHGVTGSGKTEVYMHIIENVLSHGKEAIVLVPEISLTPQMVANFRERFGNQIAILHSRLSDGERYDEWRKIEKKEVKIAIGARSAIFSPFTAIGVIIIDEEHTTTYKQENTPRYNAIDVASYRSKTHNCPLVLGSATPAVESYTKAKEGIYTLIEMNERVNKNMPKVELVDMRDEIKKGNSIISEPLFKAIEKRLNNNEQTIILLNRRGFTTVISCSSCGYTDKCSACDIPLTYHQKDGKMKCHYCNYEKPVLTICPVCKSTQISHYGMGTEKLEAELKKLFARAKVIRMDVDTTTKKGSHERIIADFKNKQYDILIGTQMIAKGLDFPDVTLVGVIGGDALLNIPDFRSSERTFQLLSQVAGRAGRGAKLGEVIIQGFNTDHYALLLASIHDYKTFYQRELAIRKTLKYPPFCNLTFIKIVTADEQVGLAEAEKITLFLKKHLKDTIVLGPTLASIPKINNNYNIQIIIKYKNILDIYKELDYINNHYRTSKIINLSIDINPLRM